MAKEAARLNQQAKVFWFQNGDRNTKFFHNSIKACQQRNKITQLTCEYGTMATDVFEIRGLITHYFQDHFHSSPTNCSRIIQLVQPKIDEVDNEESTGSFSDEDFKVALFQMDPNKSPDPNSLNSAFFQKH